MSMSPEPVTARSPPMAKGSPAWLVASVAVVLFLVGLGGGYLLFRGTSGGGATSNPGTVSGLPVPSTIPTVQGWDRNTSFTYLNFGLNTNVTAPILVLTENGMAVAGQHNIIDVLPGQPGYTAFWRVYQVAVPSGYLANTIRSFAQVQALGYPVTATTTVVNCPVINPGTTIQGPNTAVVQGWYRNASVDYWAGETHSVTYGDVVGTAPLYALVYANGTEVPGQRHIVDVQPGQPGYSDLWQIVHVLVPSSYVANTYESRAALLAAQSQGSVTITATSTLVNCPVVT